MSTVVGTFGAGLFAFWRTVLQCGLLLYFGVVSEAFTSIESVAGDGSPLALCVAVRDTPENVLEWVQYHEAVGVGKFYLMVTDDPDVGALEHVLRRGYAVGWLSSSERSHKFIGFWDIDEFIVPIQRLETNFAKFLTSHMMHVGGVAINWRIVGPSGHVTKPATGGVLENYQACTPWRYSENEEIKSVVNTKFAVAPLSDPHTFSYKEGYFAVDCHGRRVEGGRNPRGVESPPPFALYHYVTKSKEEYREKMRRGSAMGNRKDEDYFNRIQNISTSPCSEAATMRHM
eukprot:jgi/Picre1/35113/NNA_002576.t1